MKDFTFSDGITIPAGNLITVPMLPIHLDPVRGPFGLSNSDSELFFLRRFTTILKGLTASDLRKCGEKAAKMPSTNWRPLISIILYLGTVVKHGV
jgi:hypothetical protein